MRWREVALRTREIAREDRGPLPWSADEACATDPRPSRRATLLDLAVIAALVLWFYAPFMRTGLPPGDFASDIMVAEVQADLVTSPWSITAWNPLLMCGRPTLAYPSPSLLYTWPFAGLEPITRMKAILLAFHVLAGFTMYALARSSGAGRAAALFGGLVYPVMSSHVSRTGVHGHVHVVMFFALLPLLFQALFRLRRFDLRGTLVLGLVLAACLYRDTQRCLLSLIVVGLVLLGHLAVDAWRSWRDRRPHLDAVSLTASLGAGCLVAVAINAIDIVPRFLEPHAAGFSGREQAYWLDKWSLRNVYSLFDWDRRLGEGFEDLGLEFYGSMSRYLGLSLCALVLAGLVLGLPTRRLRARFWFVLLLLPLSLWLSFGNQPVLPELIDRWAAVFASPEASPLLKVAIPALAAGASVAMVIGLGRILPLSRGRGLAALGLLAAGGLVLLGTAPLPLIRRSVFFLRDFRNPDWFQVALSSFATCFAAALALGAIGARLGPRLRCVAVVLAITLAFLDFQPNRQYLTDNQSTAEWLADLRESVSVIAEDDSEFRVMPAGKYANQSDFAYVFHGKPLAWDFRSYTAPGATGELLSSAFFALRRDRPATASALAGLANVKYVVDTQGTMNEVSARSGFQRISASRSAAVYQNLRFEPLVRARPGAAVLVGGTKAQVLQGATTLPTAGLGLVHFPEAPEPRLLLGFDQLYLGAEVSELAAGAPPAQWLNPRDFLQPGSRHAFSREPELSWSRPSPERLLVEIDLPEAGLVVVAESHHPRWTARLDGEPVDVLKADHAFLGALVPEGRHVLELRFQRAPHVALAAAVSLLSLVALAGAGLFLAWPARPERSEVREPRQEIERDEAPAA